MFVAQIVLPGVATLYAAVGGIWGTPDVIAVVGTIAAVDTFLGSVLRVLKNGYEPAVDGHIVIDKSGTKDVYQLVMDTSPDVMDRRMNTNEPVIFKVVPAQKPV